MLAPVAALCRVVLMKEAVVRARIESRLKRDAEAVLAKLRISTTEAIRRSAYEVELPGAAFLTQKSYANVQGLQAIQHRELRGPVGTTYGLSLEKILVRPQPGRPADLSVIARRVTMKALAQADVRSRLNARRE